MVRLKNRDYKHTHPMRIFLSYYRPHKRLFILDMVCAFLICLIDLAFPYVSRLSMRRRPDGAVLSAIRAETSSSGFFSEMIR